MGFNDKINFLFSTFSIFTGAKSFEKNPVIGNSYLNQRGLHLFRMKTAHWIASLHRSALSRDVKRQYQEQYDKHGYVCIENYLPADAFSMLQKNIMSDQWNRLDMNQGGVITRRVLLDAGSLPRDLGRQRRQGDAPGAVARARGLREGRQSPQHWHLTLLPAPPR